MKAATATSIQAAKQMNAARGEIRPQDSGDRAGGQVPERLNPSQQSEGRPSDVLKGQGGDARVLDGLSAADSDTPSVKILSPLPPIARLRLARDVADRY